MYRTKHLISLFLILLSGCLRGPTGPAGRDGAGNILKDSVLIDLKTASIMYEKFRHTYLRIGDLDVDGLPDSVIGSYVLSPLVESYYNNSDTANIKIDSVPNIRPMFLSLPNIFIKSKYKPKEWYGFIENYSLGMVIDSSTSYDSKSSIEERFSDPSIIDNTKTTYYKFGIENTGIGYPVENIFHIEGKGFVLEAFFGSLKQGKLKIYYW